jgi:hypothetical protein
MLCPPAKEGYLLKRRSGLLNASHDSLFKTDKRWISLKNGFLFIFDNEPSGVSVKPKTTISLFNCTVRIVDEIEELEPSSKVAAAANVAMNVLHPRLQKEEFCFYLSAQNGQYRRYFLASSAKERYDWVYSIIANAHGKGNRPTMV